MAVGLTVSAVTVGLLMVKNNAQLNREAQMAEAEKRQGMSRITGGRITPDPLPGP